MCETRREERRGEHVLRRPITIEEIGVKRKRREAHTRGSTLFAIWRAEMGRSIAQAVLSNTDKRTEEGVCLDMSQLETRSSVDALFLGFGEGEGGQ
jgi:hypothetical protein